MSAVERDDQYFIPIDTFVYVAADGDLDFLPIKISILDFRRLPTRRLISRKNGTHIKNQLHGGARITTEEKNYLLETTRSTTSSRTFGLVHRFVLRSSFVTQTETTRRPNFSIAMSRTTPSTVFLIHRNNRSQDVLAAQQFIFHHCICLYPLGFPSLLHISFGSFLSRRVIHICV